MSRGCEGALQPPRPIAAQRCRRAHAALLYAALLITACILSSDLAAAVIRVGPSEAFTRIADVAKAARDGDIVEILPGEYRGDVTVWNQKRLLIRGMGERPVLIADGKNAEGKAIWVIRNGDIQIENIAFRGARASDGNGAGIRFERGRLLVTNSSFVDNQIGLLTANFEDAELVIRDSLFAQAPRQTQPLPHLLYVGRIARFEISGSRLHQGYHGHLLKSRARYNDIRYNLLLDGPGGEASYEIDLPNGGLAFLIGNIIGQSAGTQNPVVIAYGAEGKAWPDSALYLSHNTLLSDRLTGTWFLRTFSDRLPGNVEVLGINNITAGVGAFTLAASGEFRGNVPLPPGSLLAPDALDFRPSGAKLLRHLITPAGSARGVSLVPEAEFALPIGTRPLTPSPDWLPGALQNDF
ncbi:hypothetical protein [Thauera sp.]|uniref:hypothetical protein n=1 Tax=Thauera sp. TaxID=1905334 RepID=UPI002579DB36|nr:hypothetical protein [Thauera sp.]